MDGNLFTLCSIGFKVDDGGGEFVVIEGGNFNIEFEEGD